MLPITGVNSSTVNTAMNKLFNLLVDEPERVYELPMIPCALMDVARVALEDRTSTFRSVVSLSVVRAVPGARAEHFPGELRTG